MQRNTPKITLPFSLCQGKYNLRCVIPSDIHPNAKRHRCAEHDFTETVTHHDDRGSVYLHLWVHFRGIKALAHSFALILRDALNACRESYIYIYIISSRCGIYLITLFHIIAQVYRLATVYCQVTRYSQRVTQFNFAIKKLTNLVCMVPHANWHHPICELANSSVLVANIFFGIEDDNHNITCWIQFYSLYVC